MRLQPTSRRARFKIGWRFLWCKWPRPSLAAETPRSALLGMGATIKLLVISFVLKNITKMSVLIDLIMYRLIRKGTCYL